MNVASLLAILHAGGYGATSAASPDIGGGAAKLGFVEVWGGRCTRLDRDAEGKPAPVLLVASLHYACCSQVGGGTRATSSALHKGGDVEVHP